MWHPHPDDLSPEKASTAAHKARLHTDEAPLKMFHRYYDRHLDNCEGYVKLAEYVLFAASGRQGFAYSPKWSWPLPGHPDAMKMCCRHGYFHTSA